MASFVAFVTLVVLAAAFAGAGLRRNLRRAGVALSLAMAASRLIALLCLGAIAWNALCREQESSADDEPARDEDHVLLLQDASRSMEFLASPDMTRTEMAERTWRDLGDLARRTGTRVRRLLFARTVVRERDAGSLDTGATHITGALADALGREGTRAVVLVSDGAATDGPLPEYLVEWARNRDISVFSVLTAQAGRPAPDVELRDAECAPTNPSSVDVRVVCRGVEEGTEGTLELSIDGRVVVSTAIALHPDVRTSLEVPELANGWHEYEVAVRTDLGEVTAANNSRVGVFRCTTAQTILFVSGPLRPDTPHVLAALRRARPERVVVWQASTSSENVNARDVRMAVVADVAPADLPASLLAAVEEGRTLLVLLAGDRLDEWVSSSSSRFPLAAVGPLVSMGNGDAPGYAAPGPGARSAGIVLDDSCRLPVDRVYTAEPRASSSALLVSRADSEQKPILIADDADGPSCVVLLSPATWRWGLSPDAAVREAHAAVWGALVEWVMDEGPAGGGLDIRMAAHAADLGSTRVTVAPKPPLSADDLHDVRLEITSSGTRTVVAPKRAGGCWTHTHLGGSGPRVVWFTASASAAGREVSSERVPVLDESAGAELRDARPRPERLRVVVSAEEYFAVFGERARVLERALATPVHVSRDRLIRPAARRFAVEAALALVCLAAVAVEWFLERRVYEWKDGTP